MGMDDFVRTGLAAKGDQRRVVTDAQAPYFGAVIDDHTLAPAKNATIFTTRYSDWIDATSQSPIGKLKLQHHDGRLTSTGVSVRPFHNRMRDNKCCRIGLTPNRNRQ